MFPSREPPLFYFVNLLSRVVFQLHLDRRDAVLTPNLSHTRAGQELFFFSTDCHLRFEIKQNPSHRDSTDQHTHKHTLAHPLMIQWTLLSDNLTVCLSVLATCMRSYCLNCGFCCCQVQAGSFMFHSFNKTKHLCFLSVSLSFTVSWSSFLWVERFIFQLSELGEGIQAEWMSFF